MNSPVYHRKNIRTAPRIPRFANVKPIPKDGGVEREDEVAERTRDWAKKYY
jgi:hypothetical protein